ncbi:MAG: Zn-dependent hydrolase, partial [Gammaproteobacteria bacterium]|nr:Zn-dependent hydrolase [Gammaproteobacteria bacterium]
MSDTPTINGARLMQRIAELGQFGALPGGGTNRLALSDADRAARDWTVQQMRALDMDVEIDAIGNVFATYAGTADLPPVATGSHIDTVRT